MSTTASNNMAKCYKCGTSIEVTSKIHRRDQCPKCSVSLHACKFCTFYDPKHYNECRETSADRVVDKEKENFCDFFRIVVGNNTGSQPNTDADQARKKLDDLFK